MCAWLQLLSDGMQRETQDWGPLSTSRKERCSVGSCTIGYDWQQIFRTRTIKRMNLALSHHYERRGRRDLYTLLNNNEWQYTVGNPKVTKKA